MKIIPYKKGVPITEPGIYSGVPMAVYHSQALCDGPSVSSSGLRTIFTKSPAHFYATWPGNPECEPPEDTAAFTLGRAAHHLLLSEDFFTTLFIMRPEELAGKPWQGNRTECKAWLKDQSVAGRTVLKPDDIKSIRGMARSLAQNSLVMQGILNGGIELTLAWKDKETGVWLKARPDAVPNDSGDVADLKTSVDIGFQLDRSISKYRYDMQAALVGRGLQEVLDMKMETFSFVFVEKAAPFSTDVLTLHHEDIQYADLDLQVALKVFANCLKTGEWFGPSGKQFDSRYAQISDNARLDAGNRRSFLEREIAA